MWSVGKTGSKQHNKNVLINTRTKAKNLQQKKIVIDNVKTSNVRRPPLVDLNLLNNWCDQLCLLIMTFPPPLLDSHLSAEYLCCDSPIYK